MKTLRSILLIALLLQAMSCKEKPDVVAVEPEETIEQKYAAQEPETDSPYRNGPIETRAEMVEIMQYLHVIDPNDELVFRHVERSNGGLSRPCPYDDNGSLVFLADTADPPGTYYDLPGPVMEHSSQDHFPYWIEEVFYLASDQKLLMKLSALQSGPNGYYTDESFDKTKLAVWQYKDLGALIELEGKLFLNQSKFETLPPVECPEYEP